MLSRGDAKRLRALTRRRGREREGRFLAEGVRVVEELLTGGIVPDLVLVSSSLEDTERGAELLARLQGLADVTAVSDRDLSELAGTSTPQGVLVMAETPQATLDDLAPGDSSVLLVMDGVQDPGNLGTLARSAAAFGCDGLIALTGTVDPWNGKAVRSSAGALFRFPVVQPDLEAFVAWRTDHRYALLGADAGGTPVEGWRAGVGLPALSRRVALVLGNEGAGLTGPVAEACDRLVAIPMRGGTESLNVAVAGSILLYELTRER